MVPVEVRDRGQNIGVDPDHPVIWDTYDTRITSGMGDILDAHPPISGNYGSSNSHTALNSFFRLIARAVHAPHLAGIDPSFEARLLIHQKFLTPEERDIVFARLGFDPGAHTRSGKEVAAEENYLYQHPGLADELAGEAEGGESVQVYAYAFSFADSIPAK